jgi:outer membrane protein assembly factor BamA
VNRVIAFAFACVACGAAPRATHPMVLASAPHVPTIAERRADVCGRGDLVTLEGPLVASGTTQPEHGAVKSVSARDASGRDVVVDAQTLALVTRGAAFDAAQAREVVRRLWTSGKWDDVAVETARDGDGIGVVFRVTPKREIANVFASDESDAAVLRISQGALYDPVAIVSSRGSYVKELAREGRLDASVVVSSAFADVDHRAVDVCVRIERGPLVVLGSVVVTGSAYAPVLEPIFAAHTHGAPLADDVLERDLLLAAAALYDRGLLTHKINKTIERKGDELTVRVDVTDGPVYRYSHIDVRGDLAAPKAEYAKLVTPKTGDVFNRAQMLAVIEKMRALGSDIEPETTLDEKTHTVALVLAIKHPKR